MLGYVEKLYYLIYILGFSLVGQELGEITIYNTNNSNLSYNQINCIEFDSENRLWIGTENGLNVFEETNNNWSNFDTISTPWCYLPTNTITALEFANDLSTMFIGTTNGMINYEDEGSPINDQTPGSGSWYPAFGASCYPNNGIINCIRYHDGIWAGSPDGLCAQYLGAEGSWLLQNTNSGFYSNNITSLSQATNTDMIAIGTMNGGLITYNGEFNIYYSSNSDILDNTVFDAVFDLNNNIIICTPQAGMGVLTINGSWVWFNTINSSLPSNSLKNIVVDNNNDLWITTLENGLVHYTNNVFYNYTVENSSLPDNKINCLTFGPNNHLWLGTETSGLIKINNAITPIKQYENSENIVYPSVFNSFINIDLYTPSYISIFNQNGQLIERHYLTNQYNILSMEHYKAGIYIINIQSKQSSFTSKIAKY